MTIKELLEKLINHYEHVIEEYSRTHDYSLLEQCYVHTGICACAKSKFNQHIYNTDWMRLTLPRMSVVWDKYPQEYFTPDRNLQLLSVRIIKMADILAGDYGVRLYDPASIY